MAEQLMVAIRDAKAEVFSRPMFYVSRGVAMRDFADAVNGNPEESAYAKHPEDFGLFVVGSFDDNSGMLVPVMQPQMLCTALELKAGAGKVVLG